MNYWNEDVLIPRVDTLVADFTEDADTLPVAHPERYVVGDLIRVGKDDLYDSGRVDEWGQPIMLVHNEAVRVLEVPSMRVMRAVGANGRRFVPVGDITFLFANRSAKTDGANPVP